MKKIIISAALFFLSYSEISACAWYDPDYEYFNLFTQTIIQDKSYTPFLLTYSERFYDTENVAIPDENIEAWQAYFGKNMSYKDAEYIVNQLSITELNKIKKGETPTDSVLSKLGQGFYQQYKEGLDYLIEAKYLEPYMRIKFVASPDSFYYYQDENNDKNATDLDYNKTISALKSLYNAAENPEIKLRYGYQLVRFNHYTRNFQEALNAFNQYVKPLNLRSAPYYLALDQLAGAQRGLGENADANWNFFQVFMHTKSRKQSAFVSMQLTHEESFLLILDRANTKEEKCMAYFLLGYQDFNNPIPMMQKIYDIDPNSEALKVLAARAINELEREYLPSYYSNNSDENKTDQKAETSEKEQNWWASVKSWFKNIFSSKSDEFQERNNHLADQDYLSNPDRIPLYDKQSNRYYYTDNQQESYLSELETLSDKIKNNSTDDFWKIADAYINFLSKKYDESNKILNEIETQNPDYITQIQRMKMLNDIVSQPKITSQFEEYLYNNYKDFFVESPQTDSTYYYLYNPLSTEEFLKDVLANRYFLQGEDAKSFLMNNQLSDLTFNPNLHLAKALQTFFNKKNKTIFEEQIIEKNKSDIGNPEAFFNVIYGDFAMRDGDFKAAENYYKKGNGFSIYTPTNTSEYNGFNNISSLIFGHNVWVSYHSPEKVSMSAESFVSEFPFIKPKMNKEELANAAFELQKIGKGKEERSAKANQLIGNLLYNTSKLGYFRQVFVMDIDNTNGGKFSFYSEKIDYQYYYKGYSWRVYIKPDNFDLAIDYYKRALQSTPDKEQKAKILFQMASAEQGKYYQFEANQPEIDYRNANWVELSDQQEKDLIKIKNQQYRTYFSLLKKDYGDTETAKNLMGSCTYFDYFMKK